MNKLFSITLAITIVILPIGTTLIPCDTYDFEGNCASCATGYYVAADKLSCVQQPEVANCAQSAPLLRAAVAAMMATIYLAMGQSASAQFLTAPLRILFSTDASLARQDMSSPRTN